MKKILCVSDQIDPVVYDKNIADRFKDIDFIISAGDLPMEYLDFIQASLKKPLFFVFGSHYLKALTYYHPEMSEKTHANGEGGVNIYKKNNTFKSACCIYLGFKTYKLDSILIAGISGVKKQNEGKNQFTEGQMKRKLLKLFPHLLFNKIRYGRWLDILITHAPPAAADDEDVGEDRFGFKCFLPFIRFFKPKYLVHGHVHIYNPETGRVSYSEKTEVVNAYSRYILEINA